MNGGSRIFGARLGASSDPDTAAPESGVSVADFDPPETDFDPELYAPTETGLPWSMIGAVIAVIIVALWINAMVWMALPALKIGLLPIALTQFIASLCVPPMLVALLWLLAMRSSRAEAQRFGATARQMRAEAAALERTVAVISHQIDSNRRMLAEQTTALLAMGEGATERLVAISNGMAQEIKTAGAQTTRLTTAIATAEASLGVLLASLPRAQSETREMAGTLEAAGLAASERTAALDAQLVALSERGREADSVASGAAAKLAAHIARMEATSETAGARLEGVTSSMSGAVDALLARTASAVDEARKGISAQGEAMLAMLEANQAALDRASRDSVDSLGVRIGDIESVIGRITDQLDAQRTTGQTIVAGLDQGLAQIEARVADFHGREIERAATLNASIAELGGTTQTMNEALGAGDVIARQVIATAETLLTSLDAAAREIDETLPDALARLNTRIGESRGIVAGAKPELLALVTAAQSTHDAIAAIAQVIDGQRATLDHLSLLMIDTLTAGRDKAQEIGATLDEAFERTHDFTEQAAPRLVEALIRVRDTAATAADHARKTLSSVIPEAAESLERASAHALQRAVGSAVEQQVIAIGAAADEAVEAAARASERLTRQMMTIAETTSLVERRIEDARSERDKAESDGFARRAALLIEALNSAAIDIAKGLSGEVSDSSWANYLKGDRGAFTRRAVRLLDGGAARDVARLYDEDARFREQVNRYIHDFESMLRAVLTQRDGAPLSVTLISSDMGKLYVALAQAIERLRS